jgi:hypothetical protein
VLDRPDDHCRLQRVDRADDEVAFTRAIDMAVSTTS